MRTSFRSILGVAALASAALSNAQDSTTGAVGGRVTDATGAVLPGVTITVRSTQGEKTVVSGADGRYLVPFLTPGSYSVRAELSGFRPEQKQDVQVRLAERAHLDFVLTPGGYSEAVEVQGAPPVVEMTTAATTTAISTSVLAQLPVDRRLSSTFYLAPGVSSSGGAGAANPSISGASGLENQYVVDGVTINDPRTGGLGVTARNFGPMGSGVTYEFIDGIQVRSAGTEAEYAQSTGGTISVVTKSGSNDWRTELFAYTTPDGLAADRRQVRLANGAVNTTGTSSTDAGFTLGGPLKRDRAFLFASADPHQDTVTYLAPDGFPLRSLGGVDDTRNSVPYAAKVTFLPQPEHRFDVSAFGDPTRSEHGPHYAAAMTNKDTAAFSRLIYGGNNQTVRYQGVYGSDWLVEGAAARAENVFEERPSGPDEWAVVDQTVTPNVRSGGRGSYQGYSQGLTYQYQAKTTYLVGGHELKAGLSYQEASYSAISNATGPSILLPDGRRTASGVSVSILPDPTYGRIYRVGRASIGEGRATRGEYSAAFLQDRFFLGQHITLSAGLRLEQQRLIGLSQSHTFGDNWAPRLGIVWDALGNGRLRAYASAGLYYAQIPLAVINYEFGSAGSTLYVDYFDAALTQPVPDGVVALGTATHYATVSSAAYPVDPAAKTTQVREGAAGFDYELRDQLVVGLRYVYRDMPRVLEDVGPTALSLFFTDPQHYKSVTYVITNPRAGYPATSGGVGSFEDPIHEYQAVELTFNKRFSGRWSLLGSYRWSRLVGDYEGFYRNDNTQGIPAGSGLFDFPTNDPTYTQVGVPKYGFRGDVRFLGSLGAGPLPTDRTHEVKFYGTYALGHATNLGVGFWLMTGHPLQAMAANPVYPSRAGDIPEGPRGSGIVTVDGFKQRTPTTWSLDLHADHGFRFDGWRLVVLADVFNVFNEQRVTEYDQNTQQRFRLANPDYGARTAYQDPRQVRLGVRFEL